MQQHKCFERRFWYVFPCTHHASTASFPKDCAHAEKEQPELPRLEQHFRQLVHDPKLQCLLPIMQRLMRFLPGDRISAAVHWTSRCTKKY